MHHSLLMFLATEEITVQATAVSPPARAQSVQEEGRPQKTSIRFMAAVAGNAIGFGTLLAGCWFSLQLMQALMQA